MGGENGTITSDFQDRTTPRVQRGRSIHWRGESKFAFPKSILNRRQGFASGGGNKASAGVHSRSPNIQKLRPICSAQRNLWQIGGLIGFCGIKLATKSSSVKTSLEHHKQCASHLPRRLLLKLCLETAHLLLQPHPTCNKHSTPRPQLAAKVGTEIILSPKV